MLDPTQIETIIRRLTVGPIPEQDALFPDFERAEQYADYVIADVLKCSSDKAADHRKQLVADKHINLEIVPQGGVLAGDSWPQTHWGWVRLPHR